MAHLQDGRAYHEVAQSLRVHLTTVQGWVRRFKAEGLDGLREKPRSGAKRKLDVNQQEAFKAAVVTLQGKREGGRLTGYDIQDLLDQRFNVKCCLSSVYNLLDRLGWVWITVRSKHPKHSQSAQDSFKKTSENRY